METSPNSCNYSDSHFWKPKEGWYRCPSQPEKTQWWDGSKWTDAISSTMQPEKPSENLAGWFDDPDNASFFRWWDGYAWAESRIEKAILGSNLSEEVVIEKSSLLKEWKTSVSMSFLGIVLWVVYYSLFYIFTVLILYASFGESFVTADVTTVLEYSGYIAWLIWEILFIVYAAFIYPSYFKAKPRFKSPKTVSMLNLMFGGILFGCIWNWNLTKGHKNNSGKGISYIVRIVLSSLMALLYAVVIFHGLPSLVTKADSYKVLENEAKPNGVYVKNDNEARLSIELPDSWWYYDGQEHGSGSGNIVACNDEALYGTTMNLDAKFRYWNASGGCGLVIEDGYSNTDDFTSKLAENWVIQELANVPLSNKCELEDINAELTNLGGQNYWIVKPKLKLDSSIKEPRKPKNYNRLYRTFENEQYWNELETYREYSTYVTNKAYYMTIENGLLYVFIYYNYEQDTNYPMFPKILSTAIYH